MKKLSVAAVLIGSILVASSAYAQPAQMRGSDTLFGAITDAIIRAGLQGQLQYVGGGSGLGESGLRAGTQNIAPMSRALSTAAIDDLVNQGVTPVQNVFGLDGVSLFVKLTNTTLTRIDIPTIRAIFTCTIRDWSAVPGNHGKTGTINVFRRNDDSGTTDVFRALIGISAFGSCATALATTVDIAAQTSTDPNAIGYSGLSGDVAGNKPLAVSTTASSSAITPSTTTIQNFSYPLSRRLYVHSVADGRSPSFDEQTLLDLVLDASFVNPILTDNEFVPCLPDCP